MSTNDTRVIDDFNTQRVHIIIPFAHRPLLIAALHDARDNTQSRSNHYLFSRLIVLLDPTSHLAHTIEKQTDD